VELYIPADFVAEGSGRSMVIDPSQAAGGAKLFRLRRACGLCGRRAHGARS
jgi:hypothetical protein